MGRERKVKESITSAKRVLIKIGSGVIASEDGFIREDIIDSIMEDVSWLMRSGREVILVSSGAIACGMNIMGFKVKPAEIPKRQALAAIGQALLMRIYEKYAIRRGLKVAQILLTREDVNHRIRFINARNTVLELLKWGVVPIVNENDTVAVEEIKFGDNDTLSALVAIMMDVNLVVMLSTVEGLYTSNPLLDRNAKLISYLDCSRDLDISSFDVKGFSTFGSGGMGSKLLAIRQLVNMGIPAVITKGEKNAIRALFEEGLRGTFFDPCEKKRLSLRKAWLRMASKSTGKIVIDEGAVNAILKSGKSLLPSGIVDVVGDFDMGDVVVIVDTKGEEIAKGIVNYSGDEVRRIKGLKSSEIESVLGYKTTDEVIHRDNLVVISSEMG
ncbi:MAG: glutamate 5-kinase [Thermosulfidibacteraceae bacterium]|jgi:glutamate 5-kinase